MNIMKIKTREEFMSFRRKQNREIIKTTYEVSNKKRKGSFVESFEMLEQWREKGKFHKMVDNNGQKSYP